MFQNLFSEEDFQYFICYTLYAIIYVICYSIRYVYYIFRVKFSSKRKFWNSPRIGPLVSRVLSYPCLTLGEQQE